MPKNGSVIIDDLRERGLDRLEVSCPKCGRRGSYVVAALMKRLGPDYPLTDLLGEITSGCPKRGPQSFLDQCGARFPALAAGP